MYFNSSYCQLNFESISNEFLMTIFKPINCELNRNREFKDHPKIIICSLPNAATAEIF